MVRRKVQNGMMCRGEPPLSKWHKEYGGQVPPQFGSHVVAFRTTVFGLRDSMMRVREVTQVRIGGDHQTCVQCVGGWYSERG